MELRATSEVGGGASDARAAVEVAEGTATGSQGRERAARAPITEFAAHLAGTAGEKNASKVRTVEDLALAAGE